MLPFDDSVETGSVRPAVPAAAVEAQVRRILESGVLSPSLARFLTYAVNQALQGRGSHLKEYALGVEVFARGEAFDPRLDPIVRVQARKLRTRLAHYYQSGGAADPVKITFPKGSYAPVLEIQNAPPAPALDVPVERDEVLPGPQDSHTPSGPASGCRAWKILSAVSVTAAAALLGLYWPFGGRFGSDPARTERPFQVAIALVPARTVSGDTHALSKCIQLAHDIHDHLESAGIQASFAPPLSEIAASPVSQRILRGSLDRSGTWLTAEVELVRADGNRIWTRTYHHRADDMTAMSHALVRDIAGSFGQKLKL